MTRKPWQRLTLLREWRSVLDEVVSVDKEAYPEAEIYLMGGATENRLTVYSDIDLAIVFRKRLDHRERTEILEKIWEKLEGKIPIYYPLHIIILGENELKKLKGTKKKITLR